MNRSDSLVGFYLVLLIILTAGGLYHTVYVQWPPSFWSTFGWFWMWANAILWLGDMKERRGGEPESEP